MTEYCRFGDFTVHRIRKGERDGFTIHENIIRRYGKDYLVLHSLEDCKDVANVLSIYHNNLNVACDMITDLQSELTMLKKENEVIRKFNNKIKDILEDGGVLLTLQQLCDVIEDPKSVDIILDFKEQILRLMEVNEKLSEGCVNDCENCYHFNSLINWSEGTFYQCLYRNKLWEKCNDFEAIE